MVASDGRIFSITREEIKDFFSLQTGSEAQRVTKTLKRIRDGIVAALGVEQIDIAMIKTDFRTSDGEPTKLEVSE